MTSGTTLVTSALEVDSSQLHGSCGIMVVVVGGRVGVDDRCNRGVTVVVKTTIPSAEGTFSIPDAVLSGCSQSHDGVERRVLHVVLALNLSQNVRTKATGVLEVPIKVGQAVAENELQIQEHVVVGINLVPEMAQTLKALSGLPDAVRTSTPGLEKTKNIFGKGRKSTICRTLCSNMFLVTILQVDW